MEKENCGANFYFEVTYFMSREETEKMEVSFVNDYMLRSHSNFFGKPNNCLLHK